MFTQDVIAGVRRFGSSTGIRGQKPLTDDQILRVAPSIFAGEKHASRSENYVFVSTAEIIDGLRKEGLFPYAVAQGSSRIEGKRDYTKHAVRFRRPEDMEAKEVNEIVLVNSHDGTSSYQMFAGCFRLICSNGLIGWNQGSDVRVPHKGDVKGRIIEGAYTILDEFEEMQRGIQVFNKLPLSREEQHAFGKAALALRWEEEQAPITVDQALVARRSHDQADNLWAVFNRTQENLIRGGLSGVSAEGKRTTTRRVRAIDTDIKINRGLAVLAAEMAKLKGEF